MHRRTFQIRVASVVMVAMCCMPAFAINFTIADSNNVALIDFDDLGNIIFWKGYLQENALLGNLANDPNTSEFLVFFPREEGELGHVARVDPVTGILYIKGTATKVTNVTVDPNASEFIIMDGNAIPQALIDSDGNLQYRGDIIVPLTTYDFTVTTAGQGTVTVKQDDIVITGTATQDPLMTIYTINHGANVTFEPLPAPGWHFAQFEDLNQNKCVFESLVCRLTEDFSLTVLFEVTVSDDIVWPNSMVAFGDSFTAAVLADGFVWGEGGTWNIFELFMTGNFLKFTGVLHGQHLNSWSTGGGFNGFLSHYERIYIKNKNIGGKNYNRADGGIRIDQILPRIKLFIAEVNDAGSGVVAPEYITLMIGGNNICKSGTTDNTSHTPRFLPNPDYAISAPGNPLKGFKEHMEEILYYMRGKIVVNGVLEDVTDFAGWPDAVILIPEFPNIVQIYDQVLTLQPMDEEAEDRIYWCKSVWEFFIRRFCSGITGFDSTTQYREELVRLSKNYNLATECAIANVKAGLTAIGRADLATGIFYHRGTFDLVLQERAWLNAFDCFHPSLTLQGISADFTWNPDIFRPGYGTMPAEACPPATGEGAYEGYETFP